MQINSIILAWWSGTRLWPLSRKFYPKQFIKLEELNNVSLFQKCILRAINISWVSNIFIITNKDYKFHCLTQIWELWIKIKESQILIEPIAKNTLWAITFWMSKIKKDNDFWLILSSDHIIKNENKFKKIVLNCIKTAKNHIITFGIKPTEPNTWYWYISTENNNNYPAKVKEFKEKPDKKTAEKYIKKWYFWNWWIFLFSNKIFWEELKINNPNYYKIFKEWKNIEDIFNKIPDISIDYWLLEYSKNIFLMPLNTYWNDLWSFDSIDEYIKLTKYKNLNLMEQEWENNLVLSEVKNKKIVIIWLKNLIIVDTKDSLLISNKWQTQKVKNIVDILKWKWSNLINFWNTIYRPWWSYTIIDEWKNYKTKRITVLPWKKISLQLHNHRSEHWVVVNGIANIIIWDKKKILKTWESIFIPVKTKHRLENAKNYDLNIIESQIWDYLEEDDIIRFEDDFLRHII